jgi:GNAT superfamily N-acetyltransferase
MLPTYRIVHARQHDLPLLPAIELAAARMLTGHAPASVLGETTTQFAFRDAWRHGRLWVALADHVPVGFAHVVVHEPGVAHLEELDVHPEHGRRGLGRRLVAAVCAWAAERGYHAVTLTTFRDVPWNMPFYEGLGFVVVPSGEISPALLSVVIDEYRRGLDPQRRVVMRRACDAEHASNMHMRPTTLASLEATCAAAGAGHDHNG